VTIVKYITLFAALGALACSTLPVQASSPEAWAELFRRASAACVKASELKKAKAGTPIDFSDKVLVIVEGTWPQPHMKNAAARLACLYDKRTRAAEVADLPR
jgi:hypothetical protein